MLSLFNLGFDILLMDKIVCVGKNYLEHAIELGDVIPAKPVLFIKPPSVLKQALHWNDSLIAQYPGDELSVQPECEIVLLMARDGFKLTTETAQKSIAAVSLGLDMTLRKRQAELKKQGHPWTTAKVFPDAAILGPWIPIDQFENFVQQEFKLLLDGKERQRARGCEMMMDPLSLLVYISQFFPLKAGDCIYTGTPAGVSDISKTSQAIVDWGDYRYTVEWV